MPNMFTSEAELLWCPEVGGEALKKIMCFSHGGTETLGDKTRLELEEPVGISLS